MQTYLCQRRRHQYLSSRCWPLARSLGVVVAFVPVFARWDSLGYTILTAATAAEGILADFRGYFWCFQMIRWRSRGWKYDEFQLVGIESMRNSCSSGSHGWWFMLEYYEWWRIGVGLTRVIEKCCSLCKMINYICFPDAINSSFS